MALRISLEKLPKEQNSAAFATLIRRPKSLAWLSCGTFAERFHRTITAALSRQVLDSPKYQWKSETQPDRMLDDLRGKPVPMIGDCVHR
jgi:hypothetical protein